MFFRNLKTPLAEDFLALSQAVGFKHLLSGRR
jgi:hypothetical protein